MQTLQGSRTVLPRDPTTQSVISMETTSPTSEHLASRVRLDSVTSTTTTSGVVTSSRPRSHVFHVEPVDDSALLDSANHVTSTPATNSIPTTENTHGLTNDRGGLTNDSFVVDMSTESLSTQPLLGDNKTMTTHDNTSSPDTGLHVEFSPHVINIPAEGPIITTATATPPVIGDGSANPLSAAGDLASSSAATQPGGAGIVGGLEPLPTVVEVNSSTESLVRVDPEQCTVTSLTPLLESRDSDSEPETPMTSSAGDAATGPSNA